MPVTARIIELYERMLALYANLLSEVSRQVESIYINYPYLLIVLIFIIPVSIYFGLSIARFIVNFLLKRKNKDFQTSEYTKFFIKAIAFYLSIELYESSFSTLENSLGIFEKTCLFVGTSFVYSLLIFNIVVILIKNAHDQFKILLEDQEHYKVKKIKFSFIICLFIIKLSTLAINSTLIPLVFISILYFYMISFLKGNQDEFSKPVINILGENSSKYASFLLGVFSPITFISLLVIGLAYRGIYFLSYFELFKRLAAKITRLQVEQVSSPPKDCDIPEDYESMFKKVDLSLYRPKWFNQISEDISKIISDWIETPIKESFVHIIGDPGSGRGVLVDEICDRYKELNPIKISIPKKITTEEEFRSFLNREVRSLETDEVDRNRMVIFSGVENLFLNIPGGFEALSKMFDFVNNSDNDFFWVNICDQYPWMHIESFFGQVQHRNVFKLQKFSNEEIQRLIESKNKKLSYKILFDKALYETNKGSDENGHRHASSQYFTMIWEQSNGNPLMAQRLWLNSFRMFDIKNKKIKVGLPSRNDTSVFKDIILDSFFVYNALVRHTRLSFEECCQTTSLNPQSVRFALSFGENEHFIKRDADNNYFIERSWYAAMIQILKTKNLIYGS